MATVEELEAQLEESKKEQRELRNTVITVARKYAVAHNLCSVVDQALEEAGLGPSYEAVDIDLVVPAKISVSVDATQLEGMSEEEKKMHVARHLDLRLVMDPNTLLAPQPIGVGSRRNQPQPQVEVGEIEIKGFGVLPPPPPDPHGAPPGYVARYSSVDGRVLHFFPNEATSYAQGSRDGSYITSLCGQINYIYRTSLRETSPRGENRVCATCTRRAGN